MTDAVKVKYQRMEFTPYYKVSTMTLTQTAHDMGYDIWFGYDSERVLRVYYQDIADVALFRLQVGV